MRTMRWALSGGWDRRAASTLSAVLVLSSVAAVGGGCASGAGGAGGGAFTCEHCGQTSTPVQSDDAGEVILKVVATAGVVVLYVFAAACGAAGSGSWSCSVGSSSCSH